MKQNVGVIDLVIRSMLGFGILGLPYKRRVLPSGLRSGHHYRCFPDHDCDPEVLPVVSTSRVYHVDIP
jgi:hypothetical protein